MSGRSDEKKQQLRCSFCNKTQDQVRKLIAGPNVYICDECIEVCSEMRKNLMSMKHKVTSIY